MNNFEKQYQDFKQECLKHESGWIYNRFYEIGFYENIHDIVESLGDGKDDAVTDFVDLVNQGKITLAAAFNEYINQVWTSYDDWETFSEFLIWVVKKYSK